MSTSITSSELVLKAKDYAILNHFDTNHKYDGKPYEVHLELAFEFACKYIHLLPDDKTVSEVLSAVWAHDVIEDCRQNYSDVKNVLGENVAEIVYALTNEKGKNRKERANDKYFEGIRNTPFADYVKICDRLANVYYSKLYNPSLLYVYKKEHDRFKKELWNVLYKEIFDELEAFLDA